MEAISFSKSLLCYRSKSPKFYRLLYGPPHLKTFFIGDCKSNSFKTFLNCLMGFEKYTPDKALEILYIAWQYEVKKCLTTCLEILKPKKIDKNLYHLLNMGVCYDCEALILSVLNFVFAGKYKNSPCAFLENQFSFLLTPKAMKRVFAHYKLFGLVDSNLLMWIMHWGKNYLNNLSKSCSLQELFKELEIFDGDEIECFETTGALFVFHMSKLGKNFFSAEEVTKFFKNKLESHKRSQWKLIKNGESVVEKITVPCQALNKKPSKNFMIKKNRVVYYDCPEDAFNHLLIRCEVSVKGQNASGKEIDYCHDYFYKGSKNDELSHCFTISWDDLSIEPETITLIIKWTFTYNCRILLTSKPVTDGIDTSKYNKGLFYTKNVTALDVELND